MAATELLASSADAAATDQADLAAGSSVRLLLRKDQTVNESDACRAVVEVLTAEPGWTVIARLTLLHNSFDLYGPCTWRVRRIAGSVAFAVDKL